MDKVTIGKVTATSMAVEAATSASAGFTSDTSLDGLVGLAFDALNTVRPTQQKTFFSMVKSSLNSSLFTADLKRNGPGSYDFGYIDPAKYTGSINYVPVISSSGFWAFNAKGGFGVGGKAISKTSIGYTIVDTGSTLMYLPPLVVRAYYAKVSGAYNAPNVGGYIFPCSATLPSFSLVINGANYTVVRIQSSSITQDSILIY